VGELMEVYLARSRANDDLKPSSVISRETALKKVTKTWPGIKDLKPGLRRLMELEMQPFCRRAHFDL